MLCSELLLSHEPVLSVQDLMRDFKCLERLEVYTQSIRALDMDDWRELRVKLCSDDDVTEVLQLLDCYVHAYKEKKRADDEYNDYVDSPRGGFQYTRQLQDHWAWMARLRDECEEAFLLSDELFEELNKILEKS
jgi:hypothetical protein